MKHHKIATNSAKRRSTTSPMPKTMTQAEDWGEWIETGRHIAQGGKDHGHESDATGDDGRSDGRQQRPDK
jgi:hypothetical protein